MGYCVANVCVDYADILNICVHPDYRKIGIGSALLSYQIEKLKGCGVDSVMLEVRSSNKVAFSYYEKNGFKSIEIRNRYYRNGEDAIIMRQTFQQQSTN